VYEYNVAKNTRIGSSNGKNWEWPRQKWGSILRVAFWTVSLRFFSVHSISKVLIRGRPSLVRPCFNYPPLPDNPDRGHPVSRSINPWTTIWLCWCGRLRSCRRRRGRRVLCLRIWVSLGGWKRWKLVFCARISLWMIWECLLRIKWLIWYVRVISWIRTLNENLSVHSK